MAKQEYLMLAHTFDPKRHRIGGWFISEKLDGTRAFWDGGISKGMLVEEVPYANTIKDDRYIDQQIATGLWSRSGKVIHAPDWWLDQLPNGVLLDGELWIDYGKFQELRKIVSCLDSPNWNEVKFMVFDRPPQTVFFKERDIKIRNEYSFTVKGELNLVELKSVNQDWPFELRYISLKKFENEIVQVVQQLKLSLKNDEALKEIDLRLNAIVNSGGEGVMLRWGSSNWVTERSHHLLKHKPWFTADGKIIGYTAGEEGKTGRLLGKIGALIVQFTLDTDIEIDLLKVNWSEKKILKLSGLTDKQREIKAPYTKLYAWVNPGKELPEDYLHHIFPLGTIVEFKYRELSDDGIPKEARFWRIKE